MTEIPKGFVFSQASLQAFVDCPRLFELRYLLHVAWPDVEESASLERERRRQDGLAFHRMIAQEAVGVPAALIMSSSASPDVARWWADYRRTPPPDLPDTRHAEITLSAPLGAYRLIAKYDLVAIDPGTRAVIVDWKTYRARPDRARLAARLQTRLYSYLLVRAGHELNGGYPLGPSQIEMVYWFADFANDPERFLYSAAQFAADATYLTALIEAMGALERGGFPMTNASAKCRYCQYGPLCDRGDGLSWGDGSEDSLEQFDEADLDLSFDFEQVAEVEY